MPRFTEPPAFTKRSILAPTIALLVTLLGLAACGGQTPTASPATSSPGSTTSAVPASSSAPAAGSSSPAASVAAAPTIIPRSTDTNGIILATTTSTQDSGL